MTAKLEDYSGGFDPELERDKSEYSCNVGRNRKFDFLVDASLTVGYLGKTWISSRREYLHHFAANANGMTTVNMGWASTDPRDGSEPTGALKRHSIELEPIEGDLEVPSGPSSEYLGAIPTPDTSVSHQLQLGALGMAVVKQAATTAAGPVGDIYDALETGAEIDLYAPADPPGSAPDRGEKYVWEYTQKHDDDGLTLPEDDSGTVDLRTDKDIPGNFGLPVGFFHYVFFSAYGPSPEVDVTTKAYFWESDDGGRYLPEPAEASVQMNIE